VKPKDPINRRVRKSSSARVGRPDKAGRSVIIDFIQRRIEAYNNELGGGVSVRKHRDGYTLTREDTGAPMARLRADARPGSFEVLCWSKRSARWRPVGEWGTSFASVDEALDFIANDPMNCFWT
jgi:hypothetical protein